MTITIRRFLVKEDTTDGQLLINGRLLCDTAEKTTASLPPGKYNMQFKRCQQYGKKMLFVEQNQNCEACLKHRIQSPLGRIPCYCPMIKPGNGVHNRDDGSIIMGVRIQSGILIRSSKYFDRLYERVRKAVQRHSKIQLEIINPKKSQEK